MANCDRPDFSEVALRLPPRYFVHGIMGHNPHAYASSADVFSVEYHVVVGGLVSEQNLLCIQRPPFP